MKIQFALAAGVAAAAICGSAFAAAPTQGLSRLYASDVQGAPQSVVHDAASAYLEEGKADLDQCAIRAPASGVIQFAVTRGQFVSTYAPAPLAQLTTEGAPPP